MNRSIQPVGVQRTAALFLAAVLGFGGGLSVARAAMDKSGTTFVTKVVATGVLEMQASQAAITRAGSPDVRAFIQRMVKDHATTGDELKTLTGKEGIAVPENLPVNERAKVDEFNALEGAKFDEAYADEVGVKAYKEVVSLFDKASRDAEDPDAKAFFTHNLPTLREHLQTAEQLKTAAR